MRRLVLCVALLAGCVALSVYSYGRLERMEHGVRVRVDHIRELLAQDDDGGEPALVAASEEFVVFWRGEEDAIVHLVRRKNVDAITLSIVRLPELARHGERGKLAAELAVILRLAEEVRSSEKVSVENVM